MLDIIDPEFNRTQHVTGPRVTDVRWATINHVAEGASSSLKYHLVLDLDDDSTYINVVRVNAESRAVNNTFTVFKFDYSGGVYRTLKDKDVQVGYIRSSFDEKTMLFIDNNKKEHTLCPMRGFEYFLDAEMELFKQIVEGTIVLNMKQ